MFRRLTKPYIFAGLHNLYVHQVVSPTEWAARKDGYANLDLVIPSPVEQFVSGKTGKYQLENFHQHPIHIQQFEELAFSKTLVELNFY